MSPERKSMKVTENNRHEVANWCHGAIRGNAIVLSTQKGKIEARVGDTVVANRDGSYSVRKAAPDA